MLYNYLLSGTLFWQPAGCQTWPAACRYIRSCCAFHLLYRIFSYPITYFQPYFLKKSLHHGTLEQPRHGGKVEYKKAPLHAKHGRSLLYSLSHGTWPTRKLSLTELWCSTSCFETVLREFLSCFPLIFRAFPVFHLSVIRYADHKKRPFFIQRQADETHHLLPQTTLLVYCTSLLHKCP